MKLHFTKSFTKFFSKNFQGLGWNPKVFQFDKFIFIPKNLNDNFVIDARLGWYAVPESYKVYLKTDINVAAERAFNDSERKDTESFATVEEQKKDMILRYELENKRYFELYGVHKEDMSNYDLVIDTTELMPEQVADMIIEGYEKWLKED